MSPEFAIEYAIFEVAALILAIPISYGMAAAVRHWNSNAWYDEVEAEFQRNWSGREEDEHYAWLKTRSTYAVKGSKKQRELIERRMAALNRRKLYSEITVDDDGIVEDGVVKN
jgi:hypothetical protein